MAAVEYANLESCKAFLVEQLGVTPDVAEGELRDTKGTLNNVAFYRPAFAAASLLARKRHDETLVATKTETFGDPERTIRGWLQSQYRADRTYSVTVPAHLLATRENLEPEGPVSARPRKPSSFSARSRLEL